ncbi:MAG: DNA-3-methyladenine glycosylase [candidate division KSB1 bacterium]|nr:DNA-3-methyladenine glycosylase [candidate division KSB1 bacterium]MDZ7273509.1 DNA-3-methyladenine glycosylase [candidate division KSB1 bacterium]MDZ7286900.1 DNA-3-methyladenine glycosylase [candidate division KSB1 bacterium]MDZ7299747.1 DNA-3-methyladenine glycosylase [candidate division KSB1 bacterium]MDZ7305686.1 DNA-3-methyladenine glycosylase [candidate division KSB1 bacterium]
MSEFTAAQRHLRRADPVLAQIIDRLGDCTLQPERRYFATLVEAILSQQLSVKAAATIHARLKNLLRGRINAQGILQLTDAQIRAAGISRQKTSYLRDLAAKWQNGLLHGRRLARLSDEEVIAALTRVKGIGRWTAEMFLIFSLGRLDVLPVDDLGFRQAVQQAYRLRKLPDARRLQQLAGKWRPYRSVATWYLWQSLDNKPR